MKKLLRQSIKFLFLITVLFLSYNSVFPHSCATFKNLGDKEHSQKLDQVDTIFYGEIISSKAENDYVQIIEMRVLKAWKGVEKTKVTIKFSNPCSYDSKSTFPINSKLMIYGYFVKDSEIIDVNCCNFSLFDDERMQKLYGEGKVIEEPQSSPTPTESAESFWSTIWKKITSFFS